MRKKYSVLGRALWASLVLIGTAWAFMPSQASSLQPVARPEALKQTINTTSYSTENMPAALRPAARPDSLYKSVILSDIESMALHAESPKIKSRATETVLPRPRAAKVSTLVERKKQAKQSTTISAADQRHYARIFELQKSGRWNEANALIDKVENTKLMGHVLYQRYMHPTKYRSKFDELSYWLDLYSDHPGAQDIYDLAQLRKPAQFNGTLTQPKKIRRMRGSLEHQITDSAERHSAKKRSKTQYRAVRTLERSVEKFISRGEPTNAVTTLGESAATAFMSTVELDNLHARIAASYLYEGRRDKAAEYAQNAWARSHDAAPLAGWVAGLTSWMNEDYITAANYFAKTSQSDYASGWLKSASAYWAARSYKMLRNSTNHQKWLLKAAAHPRTFYGLIATRALGKNALNEFNWETPKFTKTHAGVLSKIASTNRAMALVESGQYHLAELEFRQVYPGANPALQEAMLAYAVNNGLASFALRFGNTYSADNGKLYDAALYPVGGWQPKNGYRLDKALIHAFIRQESEFNPTAENPSGATGLMQLMPRTASYVADDQSYGGKLGRYLLKDPKENLEIGQKYIRQLIEQSAISGDLFSLAIAYNAGPGNLRKWKSQYADIKDPLLFIELIPMSETRGFVERVMRNLWIYRQRMNQPTPSLDNVANGSWARYVQLDSDLPFEVALGE